MDQNEKKVPFIISGKDLDYLSDMFEWNYSAFKQTNDSFNRVQEEQIRQMLERALSFFDSNMNDILSILAQGGNNGQ